jgi:hypothetical protein
MDDLNDKKKYIIDNILLIDNHNKISNFVTFYNITHSINSNGFFVNISKLSDELIHKLYKLIFNIIENNMDYNYKEKADIMKIINNSNNSFLTKNLKKDKIDIELNSFNGIEKEIIKKSKNFNFE